MGPVVKELKTKQTDEILKSFQFQIISNSVKKKLSK